MIRFITLFFLICASAFGQSSKPIVSVGTMADLAARRPNSAEEIQVRNQSADILWSQPRTFRHVSGSTATHDGRFISTNAAGVGRYVATDYLGFNNYGLIVTGKTNWVNVAPATAYTANTGSANFGATSGTSREFLQAGQDFRIRQSGTIVGARLSLPTITGITSFKISVWRYNGSTYDLVGRSEDIDSQITGGAVSTIVLASPITGVKEGDFYGIQILSGGFTTQNFFTLTSGFNTTTPTIYYVDGSTPSSTNYAWASQTASASRAFVCELRMTAPVAVFIGDSIAAGHGNNANVEHYSFIESATTTHISNSWPYRVASALGWTYQNMGIGGNKLYDPARSGDPFNLGVADRLTRDVLNLSPRFAFFNIGRNDITGSTTESQFTNTWASIFNSCISAGVTPVVNYMFSGNDLSSGNLALLDTYNASLGTLISNSYASTVIAAATKPWMNAYNPSYPAVLTNLYAFKPEVDCGDTIHPSPLGYGRLAEATLSAFSSAKITGALSVEGGITSGGTITSLQLNSGNLTLDDSASNIPAIKSRYEATGMGRSSSGVWSVWAGGIRQWDWSNGLMAAGGDGAVTIGQSGANRPNKIYVKTSFVAPIGTNTIPGITFQSNETSGWYLNGNSISFTANGIREIDFDLATGDLLAASDGGFNIGQLGANRPNKIYPKTSFVAPIGTNSSPGFTFQGKETSGLYLHDNSISWTASGTSKIQFDLSTGDLVASTDGGFNIGRNGQDRPDKVFVKSSFVAPVGTNILPAISFQGMAGTGFYNHQDAYLSIVLNSQRRWDFDFPTGNLLAAFDGVGDIGQPSVSRPNNIYAKTLIRSSGAMIVDTDLTVSGKTIQTVGGTQTIGTSSQITTATSVVKIVSTGGAVTVTATTTITAGTDGQEVEIIGTSDTNTVTLQDEATLPGTNLKMGANRTLGNGDVLGLRYSSTVGKWLQRYYSNN